MVWKNRNKYVFQIKTVLVCKFTHFVHNQLASRKIPFTLLSVILLIYKLNHHIEQQRCYHDKGRTGWSGSTHFPHLMKKNQRLITKQMEYDRGILPACCRNKIWVIQKMS